MKNALRSLARGEPLDFPTRSLNASEWEQVETSVYFHKLGALLSARDASLPDGFREFLQNQRRVAEINHLRSMAALTAIHEAFTTSRVSFCLWKGPELALRAFDNPAVRSQSDLDLLVPSAHYPAARDALLELGYQCPYPASAEQDSILLGSDQHCWYFTHPSLGVEVELHWQISARNFPVNAPVESLIQRSVPLRIDALDVRVLAIEDELITLTIHAAKHGWDRLIWIADISALLHTHEHLEFEDLILTASRARCRRMLLVTLALIDSIGCLPPGMKDALQEALSSDAAAVRLSTEVLNWIQSPSGPRERPFSSLLALRWRMRETHSDKLAALRFFYLPKKNEIARRSQKRSHNPVFYVALRLWRLLAWPFSRDRTPQENR